MVAVEIKITCAKYSKSDFPYLKKGSTTTRTLNTSLQSLDKSNLKISSLIVSNLFSNQIDEVACQGLWFISGRPS